MLKLNQPPFDETGAAAYVAGTESNEDGPDRSQGASAGSKVTAREWFALGNRVPYDRRARKILRRPDAADSTAVVHVFRRIAKDAAPDEDAVWTSFLPGWPDGSFH